jgi:hypothetical protein
MSHESIPYKKGPAPILEPAPRCYVALLWHLSMIGPSMARWDCKE